MKNLTVDNDTIEFGKLGKIEINFVEMSRQRDRIIEINFSLKKALSGLISAVTALNDLLDGGVDISGLTTAHIKYTENIKNVTDGMKTQIDQYTDLNVEVSSKLAYLENLVEQVITSGGQFVSYINEEGNLIEGLTYHQLVNRVNLSFTPTEQYDMSKLFNFIDSYEGRTNVYVDKTGVKYYQLQWDVNGYAAGPGIHVEHIGEYYSPYEGYVPADVVDAAADRLLIDIRSDIENSLINDQKYANLNMTDAQIDSMTSLLYNTGKNPEYFLDRQLAAQNSNTTLYDYSTRLWVNADGQYNSGLAIRRAGEHVLAEYGYDVWQQWSSEHHYGTSAYNLGLDQL